MSSADRRRAPWWRARLLPAWRWILGVAWGALCAGFGALIDLSDYLGKLPAWWEWRWAVAALPVATIVVVVLDRGGAIALSLASTVLIAALAVVDLLAERTGVAVVEGSLAVAALLVTIAALAGRRDDAELPPPRAEDLVDAAPPPVIRGRLPA
jgi:hypothetical protein